MPTLPNTSPRKVTTPQAVMSVRIDANLHRHLKEYALAVGVSIATIVELAIKEYLTEPITSPVCECPSDCYLHDDSDWGYENA